MSNKFLIGFGTPIVFADVTDYDGSAGTRTHQINLLGLGASGSARQSDKADMSTGGVSGKFPHDFAVTVRMEWAGGSPPAAGGTVDFYWAASVSGTAATANPGGVTGSDSAYSGTGGSTLLESLSQLQLLGKLIATADATVQQTTFRATLPTRYGTLVVVNNTDNGIKATTDITAVVFTPREMEIQ